jgi:hypothetical protein
MKKSLIVGCSHTHALETYSNSYDINNVQYSYANILSSETGFVPYNIAQPGVSNEYIFHSAMSNISTDKFDMLIVGWTSLSRETWISGKSMHSFLPSYAQSKIYTKTTINSGKTDNKFVEFVNGVCYDADNVENLKFLQQYHKIFILHKLDCDALYKKLKNYRKALSVMCKEQSIRLIEVISAAEIQPNDLLEIPGTAGRHPTIEEHAGFAKKLKEFYKL